MSAFTRMLRRHGETWTMSASEKVRRDEYEDEEPITPVTTMFKAVRSKGSEEEKRDTLGQSRFEELQLLVASSFAIAEESEIETFRLLSLPGKNGDPDNYAESPPDSALDVLVGDIDFRIHLKMEDFTPTDGLPHTKIMNKRDGGVGVERSWEWRMTNGGSNSLQIFSGVSSVQFDTSAQIPDEFNGTFLWLRYFLDLDNGNSEREASLFYSVDGIAWTLVETVTASGVISGVNAVNSSNIGIGGQSNDANPRLAADILEVQIRNGRDGPIVYNPIFSDQALGTTLFQDAQSGIDVNVIQDGSPQAEIIDQIQPIRLIVGDTSLPITLTSPEGRTFNLIGADLSGTPVGAKRLLLRSGGADAAVYL